MNNSIAVQWYLATHKHDESDYLPQRIVNDGSIVCKNPMKARL